MSIYNDKKNYFLDYTQRTVGIQNTINQKFDSVYRKQPGSWGVTNGHNGYRLCSIDDRKLISYIINSSPNKKEYYFMEIGAGLFQWEDSLVDFLCKDNHTYINHNAHYHIIGLNGERGLNGHTSDSITKHGNCTLYKLTGFKIENMIDIFQERGLQLENKSDLIIEHYTFRHTIDPLGTYLQAYKLTAPNGFLLTEALAFGRTKENGNEIYTHYVYNIDHALNSEHFLQKDLNTKYLICSHHVFNQMFVQKTSSVKGVQDLYYFTTSNSSLIYDGSSATVFKSSSKDKLRYWTSGQCKTHRGDIDLYNLLVNNDLIDGESSFTRHAVSTGYFSYEYIYKIEETINELIDIVNLVFFSAQPSQDYVCLV